MKAVLSRISLWGLQGRVKGVEMGRAGAKFQPLAKDMPWGNLPLRAPFEQGRNPTPSRLRREESAC